MYQGIHQKNIKHKSILPVLLTAVLVLSLTTVSVFAYLKLNTPEVNNTFQSAQSVDPVINETFQDNVKRNVTISVGDTGYSVYVRAAVVVTWQDAAGNVYFKQPVEGTDYSVAYGSNWTKGTDGYWYYNTSVDSGVETTIFITECNPLLAAPVSGYTLNVKIIAQTIQSAGTTDSGDIAAIMDAWNHAKPS